MAARTTRDSVEYRIEAVLIICYEGMTNHNPALHSNIGISLQTTGYIQLYSQLYLMHTIRIVLEYGFDWIVYEFSWNKKLVLFIKNSQVWNVFIKIADLVVNGTQYWILSVKCRIISEQTFEEEMYSSTKNNLCQSYTIKLVSYLFLSLHISIREIEGLTSRQKWTVETV